MISTALAFAELRARSLIVQRSVLIAVSCFALACSTAPISLKRLEPQEAYLALTRTALSSGEISQAESIVQRRRVLIDIYP